MTEAPERIYLDGDVEAGDGMFPRCFENAKYVSEPPVEYIRTDLAAAKLAMAVKALEGLIELHSLSTNEINPKSVLEFARTTLAELKGETDE